MRVDRDFDQPVHGIEIANIDFNRGRLPAMRLDCGGDFTSAFDLQVAKYDACPAPPQAFTQSAADPRRAAGDYSNRAIEGPTSRFHRIGHLSRESRQIHFRYSTRYYRFMENGENIIRPDREIVIVKLPGWLFVPASHAMRPR
jgi:hypothetical protein